MTQVAIHGTPDDMAVALRPDESGDGSAELVVLLQGRQAWRARVPAAARGRLASGLAEWRAAGLAEDATLTREAPEGARFDLGRAMTGFPGLTMARRGAFFLVEGPGASAGVHVLSCVPALRGLVAEACPAEAAALGLA